jgi:hypothetical protein
VGGPVARIRYYFVPPTNKLLLGPNKFFGASQEGSDWTNFSGTGEIAGAVRTWYVGHDAVPGRDGSHPDSKRSSDFPGKTPFAFAHMDHLATPAISACDRHGINAYGGGVGDGSSFLGDIALWYRPELLSAAGLADGDPVDTWADSSSHANDALADPDGSPTWDATATPVGAVKFPIGTPPMLLTNDVTLTDQCTAFIVTVRHFSGVQNQTVRHLTKLSTLDRVPEITRTAFRVVVPPNTAEKAVTAVSDLWRLFTVRVGSGDADFWVNGVSLGAAESFPASFSAVLDEMVRVTGSGLGATFVSLGEVMLWPRALDDGEIAQMNQYLMTKFAL